MVHNKYRIAICSMPFMSATEKEHQLCAWLDTPLLMTLWSERLISGWHTERWVRAAHSEESEYARIKRTAAFGVDKA